MGHCMRWDSVGYPVPSHWDTGMGRGPWNGTVWDIPGYPVPSQWDTGIGRTVALGMGQYGTSRDIPFHPNGTLGWVGQLGSWPWARTVRDIPGYPVPSQWETGMGQYGTSRDILSHRNGTPGGKDGHPWDGTVQDIPRYPVPSQWDTGMGRTAGIMALGQDSAGHPGISRSIPVGDWDGTVRDIPGYPVPSQWDTGMGRTVTLGMGQCGTSRDILFQWDTAMGRTFALGMGQYGTSRDIPFHPNGTLGWVGQLGSWPWARTVRDIPGYPFPSQWETGMGQYGTSRDILSHPNATLGWEGRSPLGWDSTGHPGISRSIPMEDSWGHGLGPGQ